MSDDQFQKTTEQLIREFEAGEVAEGSIRAFQFSQAIVQTETLLKNHETTIAYHAAWREFVDRDLGLRGREVRALERIAEALEKMTR